MNQHRLTYRPEIDGLRAIAVVSVFIFHLNHSWLPGGFVGVDIFFVISGYLITSILYNDCILGKFSLARFYQRRVARIFPAYISVALATIAVTAFVYTSQDFSSTGVGLAAASLSLANMKFMLQGNYFEISPDSQPFLHYWSLSVEEQFYLIFPLLLFLIVRYAHRRVAMIIGFIGLVSLISSVTLTTINPVWAFYLLPTRAWELCAGSLLAVMPAAISDKRTISTIHLLPTIGLLLIGGSIILIPEGAGFPGWQAIFPVVGAVAIIVPQSNFKSRVFDWLSSTNMVRLGKMSYSLYLWHWPVFSIIDYQFYLQPELLRVVLKVGISLLLTVISYHFIEVPARILLNQPKNRRFAFSGLMTVLALCIFMGISIRHEYYINADLSDIKNGGLVFPGKSGAPSVILMGDSNGSMYGTEMKKVCQDIGCNLTVISVAAGNALPSMSGESGELWKDILEVIKKTKPDYLVMANHWTAKLHRDPEILTKAIEEIEPYVGRIILLNQPPILPKEANRTSIREGIKPPFREVAETSIDRHKANAFLLRLKSEKVSIIDVSSHFEKNNGDIIFFNEQGRQLYQDATHLSGFGADRVHFDLVQALNPSKLLRVQLN